MKKLYLLLVIFIICFMQIGSFAYVNKQHQWWNYRLKKIEKIETGLKKNNKIDIKVFNLISNEKNRIKKIISIFDNIIHNNGLLSDISKNLTTKNIEKKLNKYFPQVFSLFYLDALVNYTGYKKNIYFTEKILKNKIRDLIFQHFKHHDEDLLEKIINENISTHEIKNIAIEMIFETFIKNRKKISANIRKRIVGDIKSGKKVIYSSIGLQRTINDTITNFFKNKFIIDAEILKKSFNKSWCWRNIKFDMSTEFNGYKNIISMDKNFNKLPLTIIRNIYKNRQNPSSRQNKNFKRNRNLILKSTLKSPGIDIIKNFNYQINRNKIYVNLLKDLIVESSGISNFNYNISRKKLFNSINRSKKILKYMNFSLSLKRYKYALLNNNELKSINKQKIEFKKNLTLKLQAIKYNYKQFIYKNALIYKKSNNLIKSISKKFVQYEIDILSDNLKGYADLYSEYNYDKYLLTYYLEKFNELIRLCSSGLISNSTKLLLEKKSILPLITGFNKQRLIRERDSKKFLRKEGRAALARLVAFLRYYNKKKIKIQIYPEQKTLNNYKKLFNKRYKIKISNWHMDETNFEKIDKNAVKQLTIILNKKIWESKNTGKSNIQNDDKRITIKDLNISLKIPSGWSEKTLNSRDKSLYISKSFNSLDKNSVIYFAKISLKDNNIKNISEKWVKYSNFSPVKKRWGYKNKNEYFWILSKDNKKNIFETFTISKNGFAYILGGKVKRDKYKFFKKKINLIFNSINFGM